MGTRLSLALLAGAMLSCGGSSTTGDGGVDLAVDTGSADSGVTDSGTDGGADATTCADADSDGHTSAACGGDDCDDGDATRYPGNTEVCDAAGHDDDCDPLTLGPDADADGFASTACCNAQPGAPPACGTDCDDTSHDVSPTAPEVCDGVDDDCDGATDEGVADVFYADADGDGYGDDGMTMSACSMPAGYVSIAGDCDDASMDVHPTADEVCNTVDDDCDGATDEGVTTTFYEDLDGDGVGTTVSTTTACSAPAGYAPVTGDCRDDVAAVHPGQTTYQTTPYCPPTATLMGLRCFDGSRGIYVGTLWDFDCDGVETAQAATTCIESDSCVLEIPPVPGACGDPGFADPTAPCGSPSTFRRCTCAGGGVCVASDSSVARGCL